MQDVEQTKAALLWLLGASLCFIASGGAGIFWQRNVVNWGFWMAFVGGILLAVFALCGLLSKRLFAKLAQR